MNSFKIIADGKAAAQIDVADDLISLTITGPATDLIQKFLTSPISFWMGSVDTGEETIIAKASEDPALMQRALLMLPAHLHQLGSRVTIEGPWEIYTQ